MIGDILRPRSCSYASHPLHSLLAPDACRFEGPNIGADGRHLTIATRYTDRAMLDGFARSITVLRQNFRGEAIVVIPQSFAHLLPCLSSSIHRDAEVSFVVAGSSSDAALRNTGVRHASRSWLLWLEPGLEAEGNVIPTIQRDIGELGCEFLVLRAVNSNWEESRCHLLPSTLDGSLDVRLGSTEADRADASHLATGFGGPGYLFRIQTFRDLGEYDENLAGLEDVDLSIRLFQRGLKIGVAALGGFKLLGNAVNLSEPTPDVVREFRHKYYIPELPVITSSVEESCLEQARPKIALIIDVEDWAFSNIAKQIEVALKNRFDFQIIPLALLTENAQAFMMCKDADLIHVFWREVVRDLYQPWHREHLSEIGLDFEYFKSKYLDTKPITTAVYDHMFLHDEDVWERRKLFARYVDSYYVSSERLYTIYSQLEGYPPPSAVLPDGVDLKHFRPKSLERFREMNGRPIVVGWVGNSAWEKHRGDPKGLHTILEPALRELNSEGLQFVSKFADRQVAMIPHERMPDYYANIDVLVCSSEIEGTPNPVLEAMASGVAVVSTDVGVVPQAFGPLQREFILPERTTAAMETALRRLYHNRSLLAALSAENLESISSWDWPLRATQFAPFFTQALEKHPRTAGMACVSRDDLARSHRL